MADLVRNAPGARPAVKAQGNLNSPAPRPRPMHVHYPSLAEGRRLEDEKNPGRREPTLSEKVEKIIHEAAAIITAKRMSYPQTRRIHSEGEQAKLRHEIRSLPDGQELTALQRSRFAHLEASKAVAKIEADPKLAAAYKRGLEILRRGGLPVLGKVEL